MVVIIDIVNISEELWKAEGYGEIDADQLVARNLVAFCSMVQLLPTFGDSTKAPRP